MMAGLLVRRRNISTYTSDLSEVTCPSVILCGKPTIHAVTDMLDATPPKSHKVARLTVTESMKESKSARVVADI